jgi:hypothetical protein
MKSLTANSRTQDWRPTGELFLDPILNCECTFCFRKPLISELSQIILARISDRVRSGNDLRGEELNVLRMLARTREPIPGTTFMRVLATDERSVKALMKGICDEWAVPVIASRKPPYGYFIAATAAEFLEWERVMRSQAIAMLARSRRLFRANFPELAGQENIRFIHEVSDELKTAIEPPQEVAA